ncbi:hypothetical protein K402DRAFT_417504 [Aulographum hederae CBS 113979]|uniref:Folliculin-interacting protein N-terminal domain-containing protein n=1 Tax=Aulographum hederae CBS 113979 TaxID=1176131 RepID=A0A6G1HC63_9PEZI|nr:hypothetical protein K402DRAFT_417504 [Aulographum hederae CBS 113979]
MLGHMFDSFKAGRRSQTNISTLESELENRHTLSLLFPDASSADEPESLPCSLTDSFVQGAPATNGAHDCSGGIDLDVTKDIRVLIAQNGSPPTLLFDSRPAPEDVAIHGYQTPRASSPTFTRPSSRRSSSTLSDAAGRKSPLLASGGAFQRSRIRNASIISLPHTIEEGPQNPGSKESDELVETTLDVMFENVDMTFKGTSNKIHIVPLEQRPADSAVSSPAIDRLGSQPHSDPRRNSHLSKAYTPTSPGSSSSHDYFSRDTRRRTVLITRTFSVFVPDDEEDLAAAKDHDANEDCTPTLQNPMGQRNEYPFSPTGSPRKVRLSTPLPQRAKHCRTPMYAVTIILHLPVSPSTHPRPRSRSGYSFQQNDPFSRNTATGDSSQDSSFDTTWSFLDWVSGESTQPSSFTSDVDDRVELIGTHWDVISRTLTSLQYLATYKIRALLKPQARQYRSASLQDAALAFDEDIRKAAKSSLSRLARGVKIPRVRTGQGRWGRWREEARTVEHWSGTRDQNFFFLNLLTAFLGNHTEWLSVLGPKWHRRRHQEQEKSKPSEDLTIPARTVIVSNDKMAARRLIFLLSVFLPANRSFWDSNSSGRPSTSSSLQAISRSPPGGPAPSRQQSLRRTINRKGKDSYAKMKRDSSLQGKSSREQSSEEIMHLNTTNYSDDLSRRSSDAGSTGQANFIAISDFDDAATRKSSATTTSTVTPSTAVPVPHFSTHRVATVPTDPVRPDSSDSFASVNLKTALRRNNSGNESSDSRSGSGWGSIKSLWSMGPRRLSSNDYSDVFQSTDEGLGISTSGIPPPYPEMKSPSKLEQMVHELSVKEGVQSVDQAPVTPTDPPKHPHFALGDDQPSQSRPIPHPRKQPQSPIKYSVNENDGIIDVEIPLPGFGSPFQSPPTAGFHHGMTTAPSAANINVSQSSIWSRAPTDVEHPLNVGGWLGKFHPDFSLQAVGPYSALEKDIREAMRTEPTPLSAITTSAFEAGPSEKWVDVCSCLIADAGSFTIKRLTLRRFVKLIPVPNQSVHTPGRARSAWGNPYEQHPSLATNEVHMADEFVEETVFGFDATLVDAVERVLGNQNQQLGNDTQKRPPSHSRSSSRNDVRPGAVGAGAHARSNSGDAVTFSKPEIPRGECKQTIVEALLKIVKEVEARRAKGTATGTGRGAGGGTGNDGKLGDKSGRVSGSATRTGRRPDESTLREGVERWLRHAEEVR